MNNPERTKLQMIAGIIFILIFIIGVSTIIWQLTRGHQLLVDLGVARRGPFNIFNFYTIQSNIFAITWCLMFGLGLLGNERLAELSNNPALRGAITLYIFFTGIIYIIVLIPTLPQYYAQLNEHIMYRLIDYWQHYFMPLFITVLWFFPLNDELLKYKVSFYWLIYPLVYAIYTLLRGFIIDWYPYPFLNPNVQGGWGFVFLNICVFIVMYYLMSLVLVGYHNRRVRQRFDI